MTIRYFPRPYPDEILYSVIARFNGHLCLESPKAALNWLFGDTCVGSNVRLQLQLGRLSSNLATVFPISPVELAQNFTLFNYESSFRPEAEAKLALASLVVGHADWIHAKLGLVASSVRPPRYMRYCHVCVQQDLSRYGETYWRRAHQLPGVLICIDHHSFLSESTLDVRNRPQNSFICAESTLQKQTSSPQRQATARATALLVRLAKLSTSLLSKGVYGELEAFGVAYKSELIERGFGRGMQINQPALKNAFLQHFSDINSFVPASSPDLWLENIPRKQRKAVHPLRHLLIQMFLEDHSSNPPLRPFGSGPWRCRNPLADHIGDPVITVVQVHRDHGEPVGRFSCRCGYVYSLKVGGKPTVMSYGPLFEQRLRKCLEAGTGLRATARELFVDTKTVVFQMARLGLQPKWAAKPEGQSRKLNVLKVRSESRVRWMELTAAYPEASKTEIRRLVPALYAWLYRNDREWLVTNELTRKPQCKGKSRYDWSAIDTKLSGQLVAAADDIRSASPPVRVTIASLERGVGRSGWFYSRRGKLPLSKLALDHLVEKLELFQCRRVLWAAQQCQDMSVVMNDSALRRLAGLKKPAAPIVEVLIMACLEKDKGSDVRRLQVAA